MQRWGEVSEMEMKTITVGKPLRMLHSDKKQSSKEVAGGQFFPNKCLFARYYWGLER